MSVFGGDSWAREAQYRKRRFDDLLSQSVHSSSYKKLSNGKLACLVCPNSPILDSPLMLSMHSKGSRHIAAESRMRERELSIRDEMNKRIALASDSASEKVQRKPLIEWTKAILESCEGDDKPSGVEGQQDGTITAKLQNDKYSAVGVGESSNACESAIDRRALAEWQEEERKRREKELKFTAAGWKRDCQGRWYKDENVEFDSDEEDPNTCLS